MMINVVRLKKMSKKDQKLKLLIFKMEDLKFKIMFIQIYMLQIVKKINKIRDLK